MLTGTWLRTSRTLICHRMRKRRRSEPQNCVTATRLLVGVMKLKHLHLLNLRAPLTPQRRSLLEPRRTHGRALRLDQGWLQYPLTIHGAPLAYQRHGTHPCQNCSLQAWNQMLCHQIRQWPTRLSVLHRPCLRNPQHTRLRTKIYLGSPAQEC